MEPQTNSATDQTAAKPASGPPARIFGIGSAGLNVIEQMIADGLSASNFVAVHSDVTALGLSSAAEKVAVETRLFRGLGTGGDPERGRAAAEENLPRLKSLCEASRVVMIIAGLGGGAGTGIGPVLAAAARETGALVVAFVVLPFPCEGSMRVQAARAGLERFKEAADLVVTLPNEKTVTLEEGTNLVETFKASNRLLARCLGGPWLAVGSHSVMGLPFSDLCVLLRQHSASCHFALAEASGPNRAAEAVDLLFAHPLLQAAGPLSGAPAVAVFVLGGVGLGMVEVNRIMERVQKECLGAPVVMGAAISAEMSDTLRVGILAASQDEPDTAPSLPENDRAQFLQGDVNSRLVITPVGQRPGSRLGASAPSSLPSDHLERLGRQQGSSAGRPRKSGPRLRQTQLPLEIVSKGRFEKSEPTIHKGEDLDVPTYIRRGISLN